VAWNSLLKISNRFASSKDATRENDKPTAMGPPGRRFDATCRRGGARDGLEQQALRHGSQKVRGLGSSATGATLAHPAYPLAKKLLQRGGGAARVAGTLLAAGLGLRTEDPAARRC